MIPKERFVAWAKHIASLAALVVVGWLLWGQARRNWDSISSFRIVLTAGDLWAAFGLCLASFLLETLVWQRALNSAVGRHELDFAESIATNNTSNLLKYLPGRVWTYGAQVMWLGSRGVSKGRVLYINLITLAVSMLVSSVLGGAYLIVYFAPPGWSWFAWPLLVIVFVAGLLVGPRLLVASLGVLQRIIKREIEVTPTPFSEMLEFGGTYVVAWLLVGAAAYYAALGVGLSVSLHDATGIVASMSVAWVVGFLSAITPGGLGVREYLMALMLGRVSSPEAALVLPIVTRLLYLVMEVFLGAVGIVIGLRRGLFTGASPGARPPTLPS